MAEDARVKFTDAEAKLRKKGLKFYESVSGLEKAHKKASDRLKSCQKRTTVSRNDYLLSVETTNAHTKRHSSVDLPELMKVRTFVLNKVLVLNYGTIPRVSDMCVLLCRQWMVISTTGPEMYICGMLK